jgi:hypothetical protein
MTTITTNKLGLDVVDIQIENTGTANTDMFFQEPVLDQERDYVLGISELSIPLSKEPLITGNAALLNESILEFRGKRNAVGGAGMLARGGGVIVDARARFKLNQQLVVTPVDIVQHLSNWVYTFQTYINSNPPGAIHNGGYVIMLLASPSGILRLRGNTQFWQDFAIEVSSFGRELLGYTQEVIGLVWVAGQASPSTQLSDIIVNNVYVHSDHASYAGGGAIEVTFQYSVFRYIESRLRVEVDADLAIPSNILVENGTHKVHYNVASFALPQNYQGITSISNDPVVSTKVSHLTHFYTGNTVIKAKDTPTTDWYKLLSAANVQNMRLHIFVVRRDWDIGNNTWKLSRNELTMSPNATWFATLKFVQQF